MFQTKLGAASNHSLIAYLRPETAQTIFSNFKNIFSTNRVKIPFGIAQIGKAFRNEITPKQFLFRMREFEQMELEWFCKPNKTDEYFDFWKQKRFNFYKTIGINTDKIRLRAHEQNELAHYSTQCIDVEYQFPFGWKELEGIADRGNYDLTQHAQESGKDLSQLDEETKERFVPHVIESSVGVDRLFLTLLFDAYREEQLENDTRIVLKLHKNIAPIKIAVLPLSKQLFEQAKQLFNEIKKHGYSCIFDQSGSIGKRYRRNDEIGTPICITYDFDSQEDNCVTIRNRETLTQERIAIDKIIIYLYNYFNQ
jgi:glycyl-tRNA synthetase